MNAKKRLNDGGIVITNIISSLEGKDSDFIKYEYATYKAVFSDVKIFKVTPTDEQNKQNLILIGFKDKPTIDETKYEQYEYLLRNEITDFESDKKILTDDYTPMYY